MTNFDFTATKVPSLRGTWLLYVEEVCTCVIQKSENLSWYLGTKQCFTVYFYSKETNSVLQKPRYIQVIPVGQEGEFILDRGDYSAYHYFHLIQLHHGELTGHTLAQVYESLSFS